MSLLVRYLIREFGVAAYLGKVNRGKLLGGNNCETRKIQTALNRKKKHITSSLH